jgi:hypothetical protein
MNRRANACNLQTTANVSKLRSSHQQMQVSPKAFAPGQKEQAAGEISLQGTAIEKPEEGTPTMPELKHIYYNQMIRFHKQTNNYLEIVRALLSIYADFKGKPEQWQPVFKKGVWCAIQPRRLASTVVMCHMKCLRVLQTLSLNLVQLTSGGLTSVITGWRK